MQTHALKYLQSNPLMHMDMIVPIKRGTADILHASSEGVCLKETQSGAHMISVSSYDLSRKLIDLIPRGEMVTFHQAYLIEDLKERFDSYTLMESYQAVYFKTEPLPVRGDMEVKALNLSHFPILMENYDVNVGAEYLHNRLECGALFGGYVTNSLVGFAGIHAEGSIGLLKIFEQYQKKGYGTALTSFMVNHQLNQNAIPFAQIDIDNMASLTLMRKLGFDVSCERVFWLF